MDDTTKTAKALVIALEALRQVNWTLTIPAAEYVPAIGDCFTLIDAAVDQINTILKE